MTPCTSLLHNIQDIHARAIAEAGGIYGTIIHSDWTLYTLSIVLLQGVYYNSDLTFLVHKILEFEAELVIICL
jgi:hypothetical protein